MFELKLKMDACPDVQPRVLPPGGGGGRPDSPSKENVTAHTQNNKSHPKSTVLLHTKKFPINIPHK